MTQDQVVTAPADSRVSASDRPHEPWSWLEWTVLALVGLPFIVGIVAILTGEHADFHFVIDNAFNELRTRDVGRYSVLLGPFSRDGWSHPGPTFYYLFVVPYRLFGARSSALVASALLMNAASAVTVVVIARRVSGRLLMLLTAAAMSLLAFNLGWEFLRDPWNPYVTVFPFALLFLSTWALAGGRMRYLPLTAALATYCVQTHIAYVPVVAPLVLWGLIGAALASRRAESKPRVPVPLVVTVVILAVMWAPTVIDQTDGTGNLNSARVYLQHHTDTAGLGAALRVVGNEFTLAPDWLVGREAPRPNSGVPWSLSRTPIPVLGALWLALGLAAWRRQRQDLRKFALGVLIMIGASVVAVAGTTGPVYDYRLRMLWIGGAFAGVAAVALACRRWLDGPRARRAVAVAVITGLVLTTAFSTAAAGTDRPPDFALVARMDALEPQLISHLPSGHGVIIVRSTPSFDSALYTGSVALVLEEAGIPVRFDRTRDFALTFGEHRMYHGERIRGVITIATNSDLEPFGSLPNQQRIAYWGRQSPVRRSRSVEALARARERTAAGDASPEIVSRVKHLLRAIEAIALFYLPGASVVSP